MRIICLAHYYIEENRAGGEYMLHALLKELAKKHDVTALITHTTKINTVIDGVKVIYGVDGGRVLDTYESDVIITHFDNTKFALDYTKRTQKPLILVVHNDMDLTYELVCKLSENDMIVYNTNWIQEKFNTKHKSVVVHPPIRKMNIYNKKREYVSLVNLTDEKGTDIFYSLAEHMPDIKFLGVKGGYWKHRQILIDMPNVKLINNTPNMDRDVYAVSKIVLMPSKYETYGMVAKEAMSVGVPVICTPHVGLKENLGDAGIYLDDEDGRPWIAEIRELFNNKEYYNDLSKQCIERSKYYDTQKELKVFVKAVEELCQK